MLRILGEQPWAIYQQSFDAMVAEAMQIADSGRLADGGETRQVEALDPTNLIIRGGVALIPIQGAIIPRASDEDYYWDATSVQNILAAVRNAVASDAVTRIIAVFDTPGGSVSGLEETAAAIFALRGRKPMEAVVTGMCASAGYYLASAFGPIYASPSANVGSIGSVLMHTSYQGFFEKYGIKVNAIHFGKHKVDGTPYADLNEQSKSTLQEIVDAYGNQFVDAVARQRGITAKEVMSGYGQGKIFIASKALELRMIDGIATLEQRLAATPGAAPVLRTAADLVLDMETSVAAVAAGGLVPLVGASHAVDLTVKQTASASPPATVVCKENSGAQRNGGRTVKLSPKIKAALYALELTDSQEASDEVCVAALQGFCRARGVEVPQDESKIIALLMNAETKKEQPAAAVPAPQKPELSAKDAMRIQAEVEAAANLINSGRPVALISADDCKAAVASIVEGTHTLASVQADWSKKIANDPTRTPIASIGSAEDAFVENATNLLMERMGHKVDKLAPRDMQSMSLLEIGQRCAAFSGLRLAGSREEQAMQLLQLNSNLTPLASAGAYGQVGDFPNLLSALAGKILDAGIELAAPTYPMWTNRLMDVPDFQPKTIIGTGAFDNLSEITDDEDPPQLKFSEELKGFVQAGQYANKVGLTPRMVANDDLDGFNQQLLSLGQAHEFKLNSLCVALLTANPTLPDGIALFNASHSNLIASSPGVPSAAEAEKVRVMMAKQTGIGTSRTIAVDVGVVLVPISQLSAAETTYLSVAELVRRTGESKVNATDSNINVHRGGKTIVQEPELESVSTTAWYAIDKRFRTIVHVFQTGYGRGGQRTTWFDHARGTRWVKLEGRFGAAAVGWRGILKNPGA